MTSGKYKRDPRSHAQTKGELSTRVSQACVAAKPPPSPQNMKNQRWISTPASVGTCVTCAYKTRVAQASSNGPTYARAYDRGTGGAMCSHHCATTGPHDSAPNEGGTAAPKNGGRSCTAAHARTLHTSDHAVRPGGVLCRRVPTRPYNRQRHVPSRLQKGKEHARSHPSNLIGARATPTNARAPPRRTSRHQAARAVRAAPSPHRGWLRKGRLRESPDEDRLDPAS